MQILDFIIFFAYLIGITFFGTSFFKKDRSVKNFTLGDQNFPNWVITMSIFATFVSSISYLALPGNAYLGNWNAFVFSLSLPIAAWIGVQFFVPLYRKLESPSAYTYMEERFGPWARIYVSLCYLFTQLMRVGTILYLLALALNAMIGWDIATIIILTGLLVLGYSVLGGIQAVLWTDAIQGIILIAGAILCAIFLVVQIPGGWDQFVEIANQNEKFSLGSFGSSLSEPTFWVVLIYGIFINLQNYGIDQNYIQRYFTAKDDRSAKRSAFIGGVIYLPVSAIFLFIGTALFVYYESGAGQLPAEISGDKVFPYFIVNGLPPGLTGLLIASIFAAGMSTVSTSFNSAATVFLTDYYSKIIKRPVLNKEAIRVLYIASAMISIIGIGIAIAMIQVKSALDAWWKLASIFSGGMLGLFLLGAFSLIRNNLAAIIGVIVGLLVIMWMSLSDVFWKGEAFASPFHGYLTIVFGTSAILLVGFLMTAILGRIHSNKIDKKI